MESDRVTTRRGRRVERGGGVGLCGVQESSEGCRGCVCVGCAWVWCVRRRGPRPVSACTSPPPPPPRTQRVRGGGERRHAGGHAGERGDRPGQNRGWSQLNRTPSGPAWSSLPLATSPVSSFPRWPRRIHLSLGVLLLLVPFLLHPVHLIHLVHHFLLFPSTSRC